MPRLSTPAVFVALSPGLLDVAVVSGRRVRSTARELLDPFAWQDAWDQGLFAFDKPLANALRRIGVVRPSLTVLVDTPTSLLDVSSFTSNATEAVQAGRLQMVDRFGSGGHRLAVAAVPLTADEQDGQRREHVLTVAAEDSSLQTVFQWCTRAGAVLDRVVPYRAAALLSAFADGSFLTGTHTAVCHVDRTCAVIAAGAEGRLTFVRVIDVGVRLFAEAYARGLQHERERQAERAGLDHRAEDAPHHAAVHLLFENGVPGDGAKIAAMGNPHRSSVVPLLSPVLQRLCVELKQTMRFGTPVGMTPPERLVLAGPGATIPGLRAAVAGATEIPVVLSEGCMSFSHERSFAEVTAEEHWARRADASLDLRPGLLVDQRNRRNRSRGLAVGVGAGAVVLGGQFASAAQERRQIAREQAQIAPHAARVAEERAVLERASAMSKELRVAMSISAQLAGQEPDWRAALLEISEACAEGVELSEIRGFTEEDRPFVGLTGTVAAGQSSGEVLSAFVDALSASPMFDGVELGSTGSTMRAGEPARRFAIEIGLHGVPLRTTQPGLPFPALPAGTPAAEGAMP